MSIEGDRDWTGLRDVGRVVRLTLAALERATRPGITTAALDDIATQVFTAHGARSAPARVYGFPGTVLISVNDEIVHGIPGPRRLQHGDVVKLDVIAEKGGYVADAARTVVLPGGDGTGGRLRKCARSAFQRAISVARAGVKVNEVSRAIEDEVRRCGFTVVQGLCGHGVGRTIHEAPEVPNTYNPHQTDVLTDGLVIAIEPMVATGSGQVETDADGWTVRMADAGLSAHYENTVVITRRAPVFLTAA